MALSLFKYEMLPVKVTSGGTPDFIPRSDNSSKLKASCWISLKDEACLLPKILKNILNEIFLNN